MMKQVTIIIMALLALAGSASAQQPSSIFATDITAQQGQQATLPIEISNAADLTVVGISFTLSLPQGVTVATDEEGEPVYELSSGRLNPKRFSVYSHQDADGSWGFRIVTTTTTAALAGTSGTAITLTLNVASTMADGDYAIGLTENSLSVREESNVVSTLHLDDTKATLTIGGSLKGDANGDGTIDVADIATIISVMAASVGADPVSARNADANGDGTVDMADIATVISIMAAQTRQ